MSKKEVQKVPRSYSKVSPAEFVRVWQTSETAEQAAVALNLSTVLARQRAANYRRKGVRLKIFPGRRLPVDPKVLNALIDEIEASE